MFVLHVTVILSDMGSLRLLSCLLLNFLHLSSAGSVWRAQGHIFATGGHREMPDKLERGLTRPRRSAPSGTSAHEFKSYNTVGTTEPPHGMDTTHFLVVSLRFCPLGTWWVASAVPPSRARSGSTTNQGPGEEKAHAGALTQVHGTGAGARGGVSEPFEGVWCDHWDDVCRKIGLFHGGPSFSPSTPFYFTCFWQFTRNPDKKCARKKGVFWPGRRTVGESLAPADRSVDREKGHAQLKIDRLCHIEYEIGFASERVLCDPLTVQFRPCQSVCQ